MGAFKLKGTDISLSKNYIAISNCNREKYYHDFDKFGKNFYYQQSNENIVYKFCLKINFAVFGI